MSEENKEVYEFKPEDDYYDEIVEWIERVLHDDWLNSERKVRLVGSVL